MSNGKPVNETMTKFGYPATTVAEYEHWVVLLRPKQATLGALVLACNEEATAFGDASPEAFVELRAACRDIERALDATFAPDKLNYLMLRMIDPHAHFHVLPRYDTPKTFAGVEFTDPGWPGPPNLGSAAATDEAAFAKILTTLKTAW